MPTLSIPLASSTAARYNLGHESPVSVSDHIAQHCVLGRTCVAGSRCRLPAADTCAQWSVLASHTSSGTFAPIGEHGLEHVYVGSARNRVGNGHIGDHAGVVSSSYAVIRTRSFFLFLQPSLILALGVAFAIRAATLEHQPLWRDEVDVLRFASAPWSEVQTYFTRVGFNGPLYHVLLRGWIALAGTSEYALRFFSLWFGVLVIALAYVLGKRLFSPFVGLLTAWLVAGSPYVVWYSQEVKMYTWVPALALTTIYALRRAVAGERWWWAGVVVFTTMAVYSHVLAALLIPVQVILFLAWWPQARQRWREGLISLVCLTLPYLPLLAWQAPLVFQARETGFHRYTLAQIAAILLTCWTTGMVQLGEATGMLIRVVAVALALGGALSAVVTPARIGRSSRLVRCSGIGLLGWLILPPVALAIISLWQPLFTDRYLIWCAPAFYMLVAAGLAALACFGRWSRWVTVCLFGTLLVGDSIAIWRQALTPLKSDFRAAAAFIAHWRAPSAFSETSSGADEITPPSRSCLYHVYLPVVCNGYPSGAGELILFQIPYARYTFDYYFPYEQYTWAEGPYTNWRNTDGSYVASAEDASRYMAETVGSYRVVWLVLSEADMWDDRGLTQAWLEAHGRRTAEAHFTRVDVYRYEFGEPAGGSE